MTNQEIWSTLYEKQESAAFHYAHSSWCEGLKRLNISELPLVEDLNVPHWKVQPILGKSPEEIFWYRLANGIFNVNQRLRAEDQLAYLEERDYFHDVFGHMPILFDVKYGQYVRALGIFWQFAQQTKKTAQALSNIYWYTSEFGLVIEHGRSKAYGAGVLSSQAELQYAMSNDANVVEFPDTMAGKIAVLDMIAAEEDYVTDGFQTMYLQLNNLDEDLAFILKYLYYYYT